MKTKWKLFILTYAVMVFWVSHSPVEFVGFPAPQFWDFIRTYWMQIELFLLFVLIGDYVRNDWGWGNYRSYDTWHPVAPVEETSAEEPSEEAVELPDAAPNELKLMQCPKCGASLEFEEAAELTKCRHCGSQVARHIHRED